jgi:hypothetical protein
VRQSAVSAAPHHPGWLFVAAHGGCGATLLSRLSRQPYEAALNPARETGHPVGDFPAYGMTAGRAWPNPALEATPLVVVVARTTMSGLAWARDLAAQYLSGRASRSLHVIGLVTVADQPGRLPRPLAAARGLLAGAYPRVWQVPYVPAYRLVTGLPAEDCPAIHPAVDAVLTAIRATVRELTTTAAEGPRR